MTFLRTVALAVLLSTPAFAMTPHEPQKPEETTYVPTKSEVLSPAEEDMIIGSPDAPVSIIEYASLSCPHCRQFHENILPVLKEKYIDEGKLVIYQRWFPHNAPAYYGTLLVSCVDPEQRPRFTNVLFELQDRWAFTEDFRDQLQKIALVGGVNAETFNQCMENKDLEEMILTNRKLASDVLGIEGIPYFFINGEPLEIPLNVEKFTGAIDAALAAAAKKE
jgi:protein-disulfide isomerase